MSGVAAVVASLRLLSYDVFDINTTIGVGNERTPLWEISGLSQNNDPSMPIYYGVSDSILHDFPKRIFSFALGMDDDGAPMLTADGLDGVLMDDPSNYPLFNADTESVVYLEHEEDRFFLVNTEGYRQWGLFTNFWIYDDSGAFLGNLSYDTATFQEQGTLESPTYGFPEGDGVESMSATSDYSTVVFVGSATLVQDDCDASCVRISVNTMDYSTDPPTWTEQAQYIYTTDGVDLEVGEATILEDDLSSILILERKCDLTTGCAKNVYEISLAGLGAEYNVQSCRSYTAADCANYGNAVEKTFVADLNLLGIPAAAALNVEGLTVGYGYGCEDDERFLMAATDNEETWPTVFAYLCLARTVVPQTTDTAASDSGSGSGSDSDSGSDDNDNDAHDKKSGKDTYGHTDGTDTAVDTIDVDYMDGINGAGSNNNGYAMDESRLLGTSESQSNVMYTLLVTGVLAVLAIAIVVRCFFRRSSSGGSAWLSKRHRGHAQRLDTYDVDEEEEEMSEIEMENNVETKLNASLAAHGESDNL